MKIKNQILSNPLSVYKRAELLKYLSEFSLENGVLKKSDIQSFLDNNTSYVPSILFPSNRRITPAIYFQSMSVIKSYVDFINNTTYDFTNHLDTLYRQIYLDTKTLEKTAYQNINKIQKISSSVKADGRDKGIYHIDLSSPSFSECRISDNGQLVLDIKSKQLAEIESTELTGTEYDFKDGSLFTVTKDGNSRPVFEITLEKQQLINFLSIPAILPLPKDIDYIEILDINNRRTKKISSLSPKSGIELYFEPVICKTIRIVYSPILTHMYFTTSKISINKEILVDFLKKFKKFNTIAQGLEDNSGYFFGGQSASIKHAIFGCTINTGQIEFKDSGKAIYSVAQDISRLGFLSLSGDILNNDIGQVQLSVIIKTKDEEGNFIKKTKMPIKLSRPYSEWQYEVLGNKELMLSKFAGSLSDVTLHVENNNRILEEVAGNTSINNFGLIECDLNNSGMAYVILKYRPTTFKPGSYNYNKGGYFLTDYGSISILPKSNCSIDIELEIKQPSSRKYLTPIVKNLSLMIGQ